MATSRAAIYANRLLPRRSVDVRASLTALARGGEHFTLYGRTCDLSPSGACLSVPGTFPEGTEVAMRFRLPGQLEALAVHAVVLRRQGSRLAVHFLRTTAQQRLLIGEFCRA
jgi:hypothetical protein